MLFLNFNDASYDESLYEIHIVSHICPFSLPYNILTFGEIEKGKSSSLGFQWAIFHKLSTFWP